MAESRYALFQLTQSLHNFRKGCIAREVRFRILRERADLTRISHDTVSLADGSHVNGGNLEEAGTLDVSHPSVKFYIVGKVRCRCFVTAVQSLKMAGP
jgi:hypothetical protein